MKKILVFLFVLNSIAGISVSQDFKIFKGDTINRTDAKGLKQGAWKRFYDNDQLFSETTFKNGKPVSSTLTFYKSGEKQGIMTYDKDGKTARMTSYWQNGKVMALGKYSNQEKDSTWKYYNEKDTLTAVENYKLGKAHGLWITYFPDGKILEETSYSNGLKTAPLKVISPTEKLK
ncbi:MAG: hypothetical protein IPP71_13390 [Bacteroidetes bacterium]|nr:hypothetical protein [Bacteroidota bacterium]